jgi:hypothetical protein
MEGMKMDGGGGAKPGNAFKSILDKKEHMKAAMKDTDIGVRKGAVEKKREDAKPPADDGKPNKYNIPRKPSESLGDYADRLDGLVKAQKARAKADHDLEQDQIKSYLEYSKKPKKEYK